MEISPKMNKEKFQMDFNAAENAEYVDKYVSSYIFN